ncbi:MAG: hypothetical protein EBX52_12665 [Proteobacteria bacterium]|nr:hypothetical protein [Pseudomonadota bacterium]
MDIRFLKTMAILVCVLTLSACGVFKKKSGSAIGPGGGPVPEPVLPFGIQQLGADTFPGGASSGAEGCSGIVRDSSGNIYCGATTNGSLGEANGGGSDVFMAKWNSRGVLQWVRQLGAVSLPGGASSDVDYCYSVAVDGAGNVFCAGRTYGNLGEQNGGAVDAFVAKWNPSGELQWVRQLGSVTLSAGAALSGDTCHAVTADSAGNVFCAGATYGNLGETNAGDADLFIAKWNSSGVFQWVSQVGTATRPGGQAVGGDLCYSMALGPDGSIFCGGGTFSPLGEARGGGWDAFVAKWDSAGVFQWARQLGNQSITGTGAQGEDTCKSIAVDAQGNVICAGYTGGNLAETNGGNNDAFVAKWDATGTFLWVSQLGATTIGVGASSPDSCNSVQTDSVGEIFCGGGTSGNLGETSGGHSDAFVAKWSPSGTFHWVHQLGAVTHLGASSGMEECLSIALDGSGGVYCGGKTSGNLGETNGGDDDAFVGKFE